MIGSDLIETVKRSMATLEGTTASLATLRDLTVLAGEPVDAAADPAEVERLRRARSNAEALAAKLETTCRELAAEILSWLFRLDAEATPAERARLLAMPVEAYRKAASDVGTADLLPVIALARPVVFRWLEMLMVEQLRADKRLH